MTPTQNEPRVVRPHDDGIDVYVRPGLTLEFSLRGSRVYFHGLTMEGKHNVGSGFEQSIDGTPIPEGEFTEWLRTEARKVPRN